MSIYEFVFHASVLEWDCMFVWYWEWVCNSTLGFVRAFDYVLILWKCIWEYVSKWECLSVNVNVNVIMSMRESECDCEYEFECEREWECEYECVYACVCVFVYSCVCLFVFECIIECKCDYNGFEIVSVSLNLRLYKWFWVHEFVSV